MKTTLLATSAGLSVGVAIIAFGATVKDWSDIMSAENHTIESIKAMERAAASNHYDMGGHAKKAEQLLREAEQELHLAVDAAKNAP